MMNQAISSEVVIIGGLSFCLPSLGHYVLDNHLIIDNHSFFEVR